MIDHENGIPVIPAGEYPAEVCQACRAWAVHPEQLLGWSVSHVAVTLVLPSGHKVGFSISGTWAMPERKAGKDQLAVGSRQGEEDLPSADPQPGEKDPADERAAGSQPKAAGRRKAK